MDDINELRHRLNKFQKAIDLLPISDEDNNRIRTRVKEVMNDINKTIFLKFFLKLNYDDMNYWDQVIRNHLK